MTILESALKDLERQREKDRYEYGVPALALDAFVFYCTVVLPDLHCTFVARCAYPQALSSHISHVHVL